MGFDESLYYLGAGFHEGTIIGVFKRIDKVALHVDFGSEFSANEDRDHDFRFHYGGSLKIADVAGDVVDHDGFTGSCRRSAEALPKGDPELRCKASRVRA